MRKIWLLVLIAILSMTVVSFVVLGWWSAENGRDGTDGMAVRSEERMLPAGEASETEPSQTDARSTSSLKETFEMGTPLSGRGSPTVSESDDSRRGDGSLPLVDLVGESGLLRLQNALSGLSVDWDAPVRYEITEGETMLFIPFYMGAAAWGGPGEVKEVVLRIDNESGDILRPDGYSPPTDETLTKWCSSWLTDGSDSERYRLELRRDVSDLCFVHFRLDSDQRSLTKWCCVHGSTGQLLVGGIVFGNPGPVQAMRVFSSEPPEDNPGPTP